MPTLHMSTKRTLKHGDLIIAADRFTGTVTVGNTTYSTTEARRIAAELPSRDRNMASKIVEQAQWAEGRDL